MRNQSLKPLSVLAAAVLAVELMAIGGPGEVFADEAGPAVASQPLISSAIPGSNGQALKAFVVNLKPGAKVASHRHAGTVFVYVLSGTVRSRINTGPIVTYAAGENWVESPGVTHALMENASPEQGASILAIFVAPAGDALTSKGN